TPVCLPVVSARASAELPGKRRARRGTRRRSVSWPDPKRKRPGRFEAPGPERQRSERIERSERSERSEGELDSELHHARLIRERRVGRGPSELRTCHVRGVASKVLVVEEIVGLDHSVDLDLAHDRKRL